MINKKLMKKNLFIFSTLLLFVLSSCGVQREVFNNNSSRSSSRTSFDFVKSNSLSNLLDLAEAKNKIVFVDMYIDNCPPCKTMDENVFTDPSLGSFFNKNFINYKLNGTKDNGPDVAAIHSVFFYPTLLFLDGSGNLLVKHEGGASASKLQQLAEEAMRMM